MAFEHLPSIGTVLPEEGIFSPVTAREAVEARFAQGISYVDTAFGKALDVADTIKEMAAEIESINIDISPLTDLHNTASYIRDLVGHLATLEIEPGDVQGLIDSMENVIALMDAFEDPWQVNLDGLDEAKAVITDIKNQVNAIAPVDFKESAYTGAESAIGDIRDGAQAIQPMVIDNEVLVGAMEAIDEIKALAIGITDPDIEDLLDELDVDVPTLTPPTLNMVMPNINDYAIDISTLTPPALAFVWAEEAKYTSDLFTLLQNELKDDIGGSQVISSEVEDAMFARETERDLEVLSDGKARVSAEWAELGWPLPDGVLIFNVSQADINYQNKMLDKARAIQEQTEKFALENMWKARETGSQMERDSMTYMAGLMQRKLEAAKFMIEAAIEVFKVKVAAIDAKIRVFLGLVEAYKANVDMVTKEMQLAITVVEANVRLKVARATLITEKIRLMISNLTEGNRLRLGAMDSIQRVAEKRTDARIEEGRMAISQFVEAIRLRLGAMDSVDKVVVSRTAAYTEQVKIAIQEYLAQMGLRMQALTNIEGITSSKARTVIAQIGASVAQFTERIRARIAGMEATARVGAIEKDLLLENSRMAITEYVENMRLRIGGTEVLEKISGQRLTVLLEKAKAEISQYLEQVRLRLGALGSVAQTLAHIVAGSMSSISATAHISSTDGVSRGAQISYQGSEEIKRDLTET